MHDILTNIRHTARRLLRTPMFTLVCVITLGAGIGANTAIFTVVNSVLLEPLPFDEPERLVGVWHAAPGLGFDEVNQSPALHYTYESDARVFDRIGMWDNSRASVTGLGEPEEVESMLVTEGTLPLLRVRPLLGRVFTPEDDQPGTPETVILGYGYWQRRFGGDRDVLGRSITVSGRPREIIGVMPRDLRFLAFDPQLYLPLRFDRSQLFVGNFSYQGVARLKPGVTIEQANADLARLIPLAPERYPGALTLGMLEEARFGPNIRPLSQDVIGDVGGVLWVLLGTVGLVLLVACANVANLFLVRAEGRQQEVAVRTALGASRRRVAGEFLGESLLLSFFGGVVGLALAFAGVRLLIALGPETLPRLNEIVVGWESMLFTVAVSVLAGVLFGVVPVWKYGRPRLLSALREGGRGASVGRERHRARSALVVAQIAMAVVLLVGAGLMLRTFQSLRRVQPGFERPEEVLTLRVSIPAAEIEQPEAVAQAQERIQQLLAQIPGVSAVGMSSSITMDGYDSNDPIFVEEFPTRENTLPPIRRYKWVSPEYFETMGNPLVAGRGFTWDDIHNRAPVVIITENLAREYWPTPADAIGKRVREFTSSPWREVVGVVADARDDGVTRPAPAMAYWPMVVVNFQGSPLRVQRSVGYAIRSGRVGTPALMDQVREVVWSVNPNLPLAEVRTLRELFDRSMARTSFALVMLAIASAVALLLGAVGIYGVISYVVSQRTRELGVRMALGARRQDVSLLVLRQGLVLAAAGVAVGLGGAAGLTRLMQALLHGVAALDPMTYLAVAVGLTAVSLAAVWLPAHRAARLEPVQALREG